MTHTVDKIAVLHVRKFNKISKKLEVWMLIEKIKFWETSEQFKNTNSKKLNLKYLYFMVMFIFIAVP